MSRRIVIFNSISGRGGQVPDIASVGNIRKITWTADKAEQIDGDYWNFTVLNNTAHIIYIGFSDEVTSDDGFPIRQNAGYTFYLNEGVHIYGYAVTGAEARILEQS